MVYLKRLARKAPMIERRKVYEIKLGDGSTLYRIVLESQDTLPTGQMSTLIKAEMLKMIGANLDLVSTDNLEFESLEMNHKNGKWTIIARVVKQNVK
jgi:hypothetical protein